MMYRSPILSVLLAILLALSPSACLCGPKAVEAASSCRTSNPAPTKRGCCGSDGDADTQPMSQCGTSSDKGNVPDGGCDRCEGDCRCKTAPTMKGDAPTTAHTAMPVSVAMIFGIEPPHADLATLIRVVRIESKAVPRPETTLLRLHCALTI
jgi:hypothetical protein